MNTGKDMTRSIVGLNLGYWVLGCLACLPGGSESPRAPEGKPAPPVEAELSAAPPVAVESSAARATPPVRTRSTGGSRG